MKEAQFSLRLIKTRAYAQKHKAESLRKTIVIWLADKPIPYMHTLLRALQEIRMNSRLSFTRRGTKKNRIRSVSIFEIMHI